MTKASDSDPNLDAMIEFIDEVQPSVNKIYKEAMKRGTDESEILDSILDIVKRTVHSEDVHNIGTEKTRQYTEGVRKIIARRLFLEARDKVCSEGAGLVKDPETGQCVPIVQPPPSPPRGKDAEQTEEPQQEEQEEQPDQGDEQSSEDGGDSSEGNNNGDSQSDN